jgi:hypothetical protein
MVSINPLVADLNYGDVVTSFQALPGAGVICVIERLCGQQ